MENDDGAKVAGLSQRLGIIRYELKTIEESRKQLLTRQTKLAKEQVALEIEIERLLTPKEESE